MKKYQITDVELTKGNFNQGDTLRYKANGEEQCVTGEFYIDKNGILHHSHIFPDGTEVEIKTKY